jgi:16S rRNA (guanine966-N2)-methyltransferase
MRIIAGKYRGRRLRAPRGRRIRPTSDRIRESLFNIIGNDICGHQIVDIYAGTGALGIEALSRGAQHAVFIDNHPLSLDCVRANIAPLNNADQWDIIRWDAGSSLRCLTGLDRRFGYAFIDPPYNKGLAAKTLRNLLACDVMAPGGLIVLEHHHLEKLEALDPRLILWDQRHYGKTLVSFLGLML